MKLYTLKSLTDKHLIKKTVSRVTVMKYAEKTELTRLHYMA